MRARHAQTTKVLKAPYIHGPPRLKLIALSSTVPKKFLSPETCADLGLTEGSIVHDGQRDIAGHELNPMAVNYHGVNNHGR